MAFFLVDGIASRLPKTESVAKKSKPKKPKPPSENEDDFLDAPVTTRTLVAIVALAVQEIKGLDNDAGVYLLHDPPP